MILIRVVELSACEVEGKIQFNNPDLWLEGEFIAIYSSHSRNLWYESALDAKPLF